MKLFAYLLLILNIAYFGFNWSNQSTQANTQVKQNPNVDILVLLQEQEVTPVIVKTEPQAIQEFEELSQESEQNNVAAISEENINEVVLTALPVNQCFTVGPFIKNDHLSQAKESLTASEVTFFQTDRVEKQYLGMLVYLPSHASRKQVIKVSENLALKGIHDYMLLNEPGKTNALSLGVYGLKKNAQQRVNALNKLNYKPQQEARYRTKSVYWLDYKLSDEEQITWVDQQMKALKVSQISRACKS